MSSFVKRAICFARLKRLALAALIAGCGAATCLPSAAQVTVYRPTSSTETDTTTITTPYPTNGRTRTWAYSWNAVGQLLTVDGPLSGAGDTTTYTYTTAGFVDTITDPVGHVTTATSWNVRGKPTTIIDPNGVTTTITYDLYDRPLTITFNPGGSQSQYAFDYDDVGNLTKITQPGGAFLEYTYDDGSRLTKIENDRGETREFGVNASGDPTSITVKTAGSTIVAQQTLAYDELGRLIQAVGAGSQTWNFAYDKVDNPSAMTDARGKVWQTSFDALNRLITQTNPLSQTIQYGYSAQDEVNSYRDGRNLQTTRVIDGFGETIQEVSSDRGTTTYWYDAASNLTEVIDGDGQEADYGYDNASRLTSASFVGAPSETVTYTYDSTSGGNKGVGRLTGVSEQSGSTAFVYDEQGRITQDTAVIQSGTYVTQYAYDLNGRITQITLPSGRTISFTRANDGLATAIATTPSGGSPQSIATGITYLPFGPLTGLTYGNGLSLTRSYDQNYWLSRIQTTDGTLTPLDLSFGRNANGQVTTVTDNASTGRGATFSYTDASQLDTAAGPWGSDTYTYDAAGNRTDQARTIGGVTTHVASVMAGARNQVTQVQDGSGTPLRNLSYSGRGDISQDARVGGPTYAYTYNARKRLTLVTIGGVNSGAYGYDFRGRRVWRTIYSGTPTTTHSVFDESGHLLAEHDAATGNVLREYVWLDDLPVALIDSASGTPQTYFIHAGQIDEPLVLTNSSKAKVWDASIEPYGIATIFGTPSAGLDLRLPGQWTQPESGGLFQNWHRDYDPSLGRYVEADPLGLEAGQNLYAYAGGNPTTSIDPEGLQIVVPVPGGNSPPGALPGPFVPWNTTLQDLGLPSSWEEVAKALGIAQPTVINQPPAGLTATERGLFGTYCKNSKDPCGDLKKLINSRLNSAETKRNDMLVDKHGLFENAFSAPNPSILGTNTSWIGHETGLLGRLPRIQTLINLARKMGCDVRKEQNRINRLRVPISPMR